MLSLGTSWYHAPEMVASPSRARLAGQGHAESPARWITHGEGRPPSWMALHGFPGSLGPKWSLLNFACEGEEVWECAVSGPSRSRGSVSHCPPLPLAHIWSTKQMSSLITQTFFACTWSLFSLGPLAARPSSLPERQALASRLQRSKCFPYAAPGEALMTRLLPPDYAKGKASLGMAFCICDRGGGGESKHEEVKTSFFYLNQTAVEEVTLFPSLSLVWQDILLSHIVLNEELVRLPFYWTGIASQLFGAALSVTPKQTNTHQLHAFEETCPGLNDTALPSVTVGEGMTSTPMPRCSSWMTFHSPLPQYEQHKLS